MNKTELNLNHHFDDLEPDLIKRVSLPESKIKSLLLLKENTAKNDDNRLFPTGYPIKDKARIDREIELKIKDIYENILRAIYDTISPRAAEIILNYGFIAGGCFKSMILNESVNDYDLYFTKKEALDQFIGHFNEVFFPPINSEMVQFTGVTGQKFSTNLILATDNSITIFISGNGTSIKVQLVTKFFGTPEDVTSKFDFEHCMSYYRWDQPIEVKSDLILKRSLVFNEFCENPLSSILRLHKFLSQGWVIKKEEIIKIGKAIKLVDFSDEKALSALIANFY